MELNVFQEDDVSGMFTDRKEYQKMLNLAKCGGTDVILVMKLDRLNRDFANGETAIRTLNSYGCFVIAGDMKSPGTPVEEFTRGILMLQNQYIVRLIASDTMRVEINNVKNGLSAGGTPPFGYTTIEKRYYIDEKEAPAIRIMFQKIADGESYRQVITDLDLLGYTTRNGQPFSYATLNSILKNEKYCGVYIYNRKNGKRKRKRVLIEEFDEVRNETAIPPIIDKKQFEKVQRILEKRKNSGTSKATSPFILSGLIYCKQCGKPMSGVSQTGGRSKRKLRTYVCPNHRNKLGTKCTTKPLNAEYIERAIKSIITENVNDYLTQSPLADTVISDKSKEIQERISIMSRNKKDLELKSQNLIDRIAKSNSPILISKYENSIEANDSKQKELQKNIDKAQNQLLSIEAMKTTDFHGMLSPNDLFPSLDDSRKIIQLFIKKIVFDENSGDIDIIFNT